MPRAALQTDGARRGARTRERILDAAEQLFATRDYAETTLREIAAQVGIQNPSIYKHFDTKAEIYEAVVERLAGPILDEFWDTDNEIEKVVRHLAAHPHAAQLLLREALVEGPPLTPIIRWMGKLVSRVQAFLRDTPGPPPWDPSSLVMRVLAISYMVAGFHASAPLHRELTGRELAPEEALAQQAEILEAVGQALFGSDEGDK